MIKINISNNIHKLLNNSRLGIILTNVKVETSSSTYKSFIAENHQTMINYLSNQREGELEIIKETREAYKICGKEPSRYRPSAEALLRRLRTKKELYQINNVVDTINLLSINTQYSIGGFNYNNINGDVFLDIGTADPYEAIGRGTLNIEFMPGVRDSKGFFGTPTSDSVRTMVTDKTTELLLVFYDFYGNDALEDAMEYGERLFKENCGSTKVSKSIINYN
jgi:DNA/RNA-binding domain of Phe-tRNA-synthetase-like protein